MFGSPQSDLTSVRLEMVRTQLRDRGITHENVLSAMERVPRHEFVDPQYWREAYEDKPLPIGKGQTISQPFIVAFMLQALQINPTDRVLEIGTGTGYEAALLGQVTAHVYTMERHAQLAETARNIFQRLGYSNIEVVTGDGSEGLEHAAPFDSIVVAAAAPQIPPALVDQLRDGGRMILPLGSADLQDLQLVRKVNGQVSLSRLEGCRFVPLVGKYGFAPAGEPSGR